MTNTKDSLRQYLDLRAALEKEREELQRRLLQIEEAIGNGRRGPGRPPKEGFASAPSPAPKAASKPASAPVTKPAAAKPAASKQPAKPAAAASARPGASMREVISKLVAKNPLRIGEIVDGMHRAGYVFKSSNPTNSVGAYLYGPEGKKHFVRNEGKFSLRK